MLTSVTVSAAALVGVADVGAVNTNNVKAANVGVENKVGGEKSPTTVNEAESYVNAKKQDLAKSQTALNKAQVSQKAAQIASQKADGNVKQAQAMNDSAEKLNKASQDKANLKNVNDQINKANADLQNVKAKNQKVQTDHAQAQALAKTAKENADKADTNVADHQKSVKSAQTDADKAEKANTDAQKHLADLNKAHDDAVQTAKSDSAKRDKAQSDLAAKKQNVTKLTNDKADSAKAVDAAKSAVDSAKSDLDSKKSATNSAQDSVNKQTAIVNSADKDLRAAQDDLTHSTAFKFQQDADKANAALKSAISDRSEAQTALTNAQKAENSIANKIATDHNAVTNAQADHVSKEAAKKIADNAKLAAQTDLDKAKNKANDLHRQADNRLVLSQSYIDLMTKWDKKFRDGYNAIPDLNTVEGQDKVLALWNLVNSPEFKNEAIKASDDTWILNKYVHHDADKQEKVDYDHMTRDQIVELNKFALGLLNDVRAQLGRPLLKLNNSAIDMAQDVAKGYTEDDWDDMVNDRGHDVSAVTKAAGKYGLDDSGQWYENMAVNNTQFVPVENVTTQKSNYLIGKPGADLTKVSHMVTMDEAKANIYGDLKSMLFSDTEWRHATGLLNAMQYNHDTDSTDYYFGIMPNAFKDNNDYADHYIIVNGGKNVILDPTKFDTKSNIETPTLAKLHDQLYDAENDVSAKETILTTKTLAADLAQQDLEDSQTAIDKAQEILNQDLAKQKSSHITTAKAQDALTTAQNAVTAAQKVQAKAMSALANYESIINDKKQNIANKQAISTKAHDTLTSLKNDLAKAQDAQTKAETALTNATKDYENKLTQDKNLALALTNAQDAVKTQEKAISNLETIIQNDSINVKKSQLDVDNYKKTALDANQANTNAQKALNDAKSALAKAQEEQKAAQENLAKANALVKTTQDEVDKTNNEIKSLVSAKKTAEDYAMALAHAPETYKKTQEILNKAIDAKKTADANLAEANAELNKAKADVDIKTNALNKATANYNKLKEEAEAEAARQAMEDYVASEANRINSEAKKQASTKDTTVNVKTPAKHIHTMRIRIGKKTYTIKSLKDLRKLFKHAKSSHIVTRHAYIKASRHVRFTHIKNRKMRKMFKLTRKNHSYRVYGFIKRPNGNIYVKLGKNLYLNIKYVKF